MEQMQDTLNRINKIHKVMERLRENFDHCWSVVDLGDKKEAARGQKVLKRCVDKFQKLKGRVEQSVNARLGLKPDVFRVISMKSDLDTEVYECSICLSVIKRDEEIWSCPSCYTVLHLACAKHLLAHRQSVALRVPWKCPNCSTTLGNRAPYLEYTCFCGAVKSPRPIYPTAHGCGRRCRKTPRCFMSCHPAACPADGTN